MARQVGLLKLKGTLDGITFYKTIDGHLAKMQSGVDATRIASDPAFQRTRENGAEFGSAGAAGKLIRAAHKAYLQDASDTRLTSRLVAALMLVIQADTTNTRGERSVMDGQADLLTGFDFNINGKLATCMFAPYVATIDRPTGKLTVSVPSFNPINMVSAPTGATHFKLISVGAEIDFDGGTYVVDTQESALMPWDNTPTAVLNLINSVTPASTHTLFLALGITFYQEVNGVQYSLKSGAFNALAIVKVLS
jgi:hypothetical protein